MYFFLFYLWQIHFIFLAKHYTARNKIKLLAGDHQGPKKSLENGPQNINIHEVIPLLEQTDTDNKESSELK